MKNWELKYQLAKEGGTMVIIVNIDPIMEITDIICEEDLIEDLVTTVIGLTIPEIDIIINPPSKDMHIMTIVRSRTIVII